MRRTRTIPKREVKPVIKGLWIKGKFIEQTNCVIDYDNPLIKKLLK
jgi:hypothetical protein